MAPTTASRCRHAAPACFSIGMGPDHKPARATELVFCNAATRAAQKYADNLRKGLLTDTTIMLWNES